MKSKYGTKIVDAYNKSENSCLSKFACKSKSGQRDRPEVEKIPDSENIRPIFSHDIDKILHSHAYTRYIDKTQVFYLFENDHITHRVLHVQLVSKIGRVIGRCLQLNEDLIEAIALGHDLGHVPYGHDGETFLNTICINNNIGCFYHNAQSVRQLTKLENNGSGLNLTLQVLDGILAHNGEMIDQYYRPRYDKTWDDFREEYTKSFTQVGFVKKIKPMTLEGCVVRISDIIGYIGRDIEDAITLNVIKRADLPESVVKVLGSSNDEIVNTLVIDLVDNSYRKNFLSYSTEVFDALNTLLQFNRDHIYSNSRINTERKKIENMYKQLFNAYVKDIEEPESKIYAYAENMGGYRKATASKTIVVDYIAQMTDDYFNNQYKERFVPSSYGYALDDI
jgi:dGTPase